MFPRRGCRRRGNISRKLDGETFPHRPDGETFICIAPTGKHLHELDGETCQGVVGANHECFPVGVVDISQKWYFLPPDGETFSSNCTSCHPDGETFPNNDTFCHPDGEICSQMFPRRGDTPTGKHF